MINTLHTHINNNNLLKEQIELDNEDMEFYFEGRVYENLDKKVIENRENYDYLVSNFKMKLEDFNNGIIMLMRTNKDYYLEEIKPFINYINNIEKKNIYMIEM